MLLWMQEARNTPGDGKRGLHGSGLRNEHAPMGERRAAVIALRRSTQ